MARLTGQRIRSGIQTVAAVTSGYAIESLAKQSDQFDVVLWTLAGDGTTPPQYARISSNADGSKSGDGFMTFQGRFSYLTFGMVSHFHTQVGLTTAHSADVTVMWYNELDAAVYLTCKILRPVFPGPDAQYAPGGYQNVVYRFINGVIIT